MGRSFYSLFDFNRHDDFYLNSKKSAWAKYVLMIVLNETEKKVYIAINIKVKFFQMLGTVHTSHDVID